MMEQWNSGVMDSGIMQYWINGPATGGIDDKIKMAIILNSTFVMLEFLFRLNWPLFKPAAALISE